MARKKSKKYFMKKGRCYTTKMKRVRNTFCGKGTKKKGKRKASKGRKCVSPAFKMSIKNPRGSGRSSRCACIVKNKSGNLAPKFLPKGRCTAGMKPKAYKFAKGTAMAKRRAR